MHALDLGQDGFLELPDTCLIAFVKGPLFDALSANQPGLAENFQVFTGSRLADRELLRDEDPANAILHQVSIHLGRKVAPGGLEPLQDQTSAAAGQCAQCEIRSHIDN
jgi:hypothetical protein